MSFVGCLFNFVDICLDISFNKCQSGVTFSSHLIDVFAPC